MAIVLLTRTNMYFLHFTLDPILLQNIGAYMVVFFIYKGLSLVHYMHILDTTVQDVKTMSHSISSSTNSSYVLFMVPKYSAQSRLGFHLTRYGSL